MGKAQCSNDTGGTCRVLSCNSSRKARCVKSGFLGSTSKCLCPAGSCAIGGKCVVKTASPTSQPTAQPTANPTANPTASPSNQCSKNTGGTCRVFSCNSSRKASCVNSKCVCGAGKCAIGGKCFSMTGAPQSGEEDEENFLETKSSSEADSKAQGSNDTGGTCRVLSCNSSRKARCVKSGFLGSTSKCLCRACSCAIGGKCVVKTASPTSQPTAH